MTTARRSTVSVILLAILLLQAGPAQAAVNSTDEITSYFRVLWGLLIVLAIILLLFAIFRKRFSLLQPRGAKAIRVLEMQPLMPRKAICLVEVRGREYLLGIGTDAITLLADLNDHGRPSFKDVLADTQPGEQS